MINWSRLVDLYNRENGTNYKNKEEMLEDLYRKYESSEIIAGLFKVSSITIRNILHKNGIKLAERGKHQHKRTVENLEKLKQLSIEEMTVKEIAKNLGIRKNWTYKLLKMIGRKAKLEVRKRNVFLV